MIFAWILLLIVCLFAISVGIAFISDREYILGVICILVGIAGIVVSFYIEGRNSNSTWKTEQVIVPDTVITRTPAGIDTLYIYKKK